VHEEIEAPVRGNGWQELCIFFYLLQERTIFYFHPKPRNNTSGAFIMKKIMMMLLLFVTVWGCVSAQSHYRDTHGEQERNMTVGIVQKEIRKGMSGAEVASVLGSPNIVTTDEQGREVWVYDKISTDVTYSQSSVGGGIALLIGAASGNVAGGGGASGSYGKSAGAVSKTQKTLTVIIKFDEKKAVREFAYHASHF